MQENILYSFRRCPFAIRARWALLSTKQRVILREVRLKEKPIELLKVSSKATVPVLITKNGTVIDESMNIIYWALENSNSTKKINTLEQDCIESIDNLIIENDTIFKYHLDRYKYTSRYKGADKYHHMEEANKILIKWSSMLSSNDKKDKNGWLVGGQQSYADWSIWPFVRQYMKASTNYFKHEKRLAGIRKWLDYYLLNDLYPIVMTKNKPWARTDSPVFFPFED